MKRKCNHTNITDLNFIKGAINDCFKNKGQKIFKRPDIKNYYINQHHGDIDEVARELQREILNRKLNLEPVWYKTKIDRGNGKLRRLTIEHIKRQFFNHIASNGLQELDSRIGFYHVNPLRHFGTHHCARFVKTWLQKGNVRYAIHGDIRKCYPSITHANMMAWLYKHVKNDDLLWLINELLSTVEEGLPIGSYLSIKLCALYISDIYHHIESSYFTERRGKRLNAVSHLLIYADDIFIFGNNAKQLRRAFKDIVEYAKSKGLTLKDDWKIIDLSPREKNSHIDVVGFRVYRDRITMRHRNYLKVRKAIRVFKNKPYSIKRAKLLIASYGTNLMHTDSVRFRRKYNVDYYVNQAKRMVSSHDKNKSAGRTASCNKAG